MQREQKFKKEVGFIRSHSSKGLKRQRYYQQSGSQSFSSFECNNQGGNRRQDQEFSPYKHPQAQQSWKNHYVTNIQRENMQNSMEYPRMKYPPKSTKHESDKKPKGYSEQNPIKHKQHKVRSVEKNKLHTCEQQYFKATKQTKEYDKRPQITFSNEKLRMQYNTFNENSDKIENNEKILKQVNKICERISQIKLDFEFNDSGNFVKKIQAEQLPTKKYNQKQKEQSKTKQRLNKYQQFLIEMQQKQPIIYQNRQQQEFSLGGCSNRRDIKISPQRQKSPYKMKLADLDRKLQVYKQNMPIEKNKKPQAVKGCHNPQHKLLMKNNRVSSLDDQSSIEQCLQQEQIFIKSSNKRSDQPRIQGRNSNGFRNPGVIKTTSQYLREDRVQYENQDEEDSLNNQNDLIEQYKTSEFNKKGIRREIEHHSGKKVYYSNSGKKAKVHQNSSSKNDLHENNLKQYYEVKKKYEAVEDKMQEQEGFFQSRGGVCFGIDTRNFRQNKNQTESGYNGDYLRNRNKLSTNVPKKVKKVDPKQQLLKRRQMAKNYDQMARRIVFRN